MSKRQSDHNQIAGGPVVHPVDPLAVPNKIPEYRKHDFDQLMKFYNAKNETDLIHAMDKHITKLQEKLQIYEQTYCGAPPKLREG